MSKTDTYYKILDAASDIVHTNGILDLTLGAAAEKAGVSKGGLLYHFPSKDALIRGMIQHLIQNYAMRTQKEADEDSVHTGRWTRAFIKETFRQSTHEGSMDSALMAAAAINPELLSPIQDQYNTWQENIEHDGINPIDSTILRLAVDGLWFSEIFGLAPLEKHRRERVLEKLLSLTREK